MDTTAIDILLVEDNESDAELTLRASQAGNSGYKPSESGWP